MSLAPPRSPNDLSTYTSKIVIKANIITKLIFHSVQDSIADPNSGKSKGKTQILWYDIVNLSVEFKFMASVFPLLCSSAQVHLFDLGWQRRNWTD